MDIQDLGSIGELVAALATIATLIYLARQIRHNTNQLQGEAIIEINNAERALVAELRSDETLISAFVNSVNDWDSVSIEDQARVHLYLHPYARWCETCWMLANKGALDETTYASREEMAITLLSPPGARTWWSNVKMVYDPRFVEAIDDRLSKTNEDTISIIDLPFYSPARWPYKNAPIKSLEKNT